MTIEIELKLTVDPVHVARLRHHSVLKTMGQGKPRRQKLYSVYFDTPEQDLLQAGIALRLRRVGGTWVQTVKGGGCAQGGMHQRNEWEWPVRGEKPEMVANAAPDLAAWLTPKFLARLQPMFVTDFWRTVWCLRTDQGDEIELALDQGEVYAGERCQPISEVELELKAGKEASLFEVALIIQDQVPLWIEDRSKAARGYQLCSGKMPLPRTAQPVALEPDMSLTQAFRGIAWECLAMLQANVAEFGQEQDPEYLHQAHVATRRLRSALDLFVADSPDAFVDVLEDLRWLMSCLGKARNWDVLVTQTLPQIAEQLPGNRALERLQVEAAELRDVHQKEVFGAVWSQRYTRLVLMLGLLLVRQVDQPEKLVKLGEFAKQNLTRQHARVCHKGRRHPALNSSERHVLRIATKKLRYAAEFFSCLYPHKRTQRYLEVLAALQDVLGALNDATVTLQLLAELSPSRGQGTGIVTGWVACSSRAGLLILHQAWKDFGRQKVFWK